jgi:Cdc6-like AAA superfamily ATPase
MATQKTLLQCIKTVHKTSKNCELKAAVFSELKDELCFLAEALQLSQKQAFFFALIFAEGVTQNSMDRYDLAKHLNCEHVDFIAYETNMRQLFDKGYVTKEKSSRFQSIMRESFKPNPRILSALLEKKAISEALHVPIKNAVDVVDYVFDLMKQVIDDDLDISEVLRSTRWHLKHFEHIAFIKTLKTSQLSVEAICLLLYYMGLYRIGDKSECIRHISIAMYGKNGKSSQLMQAMAAGNHQLVRKHFLRQSASFGLGRDEFDFELTGESKQLMREYQIIPKFQTKLCKDTFDFLYTVETLCVQQNRKRITTKELLSQVANLLDSNEDLQLVKEIKSLALKNLEHETLYLKTLYDGGTNTDSDINTAVDLVYEREREAILLKNSLLQESHELIKNDLLELTEASFFSSAKLRITERSQELLNSCGMALPHKPKNHYSRSPELIKAKPLFYNDEDAPQMAMLGQILEETHFADIQKRMAEKALPIGVVALLYGDPGTGKTESVYQFAKQSQREVIQVDISQSKSMWFGESEKQIKKIFTRYEQYAKRCKRKPILLFNEADALISKRKDASASNVAQTENAIQNILLEEFEKFTGICIATTNLVSNLDPAFERRFLYKIALGKPNLQTLSNIWTSKLIVAHGYDVAYLAKTYPFSGGQIDNIIKKIEMHDILYGCKPTQEELLVWCEAERLDKHKHSGIGFH